VVEDEFWVAADAMQTLRTLLAKQATQYGSHALAITAVAVRREPSDSALTSKRTLRFQAGDEGLSCVSDSGARGHALHGREWL
jgi:hypothetical protein